MRPLVLLLPLSLLSCTAPAVQPALVTAERACAACERAAPVCRALRELREADTALDAINPPAPSSSSAP
jgi:hypothetical protein